MGVVHDMKTPVGYWVQQVRANGDDSRESAARFGDRSIGSRERGAT